MSGRLILVLLQLAACWFGAPAVLAKVPDLAAFGIFGNAVVFAAITWVVGLIGGALLSDVARPSIGTLVFALVGALIGAGLTLVPEITNAVERVIREAPRLVYPLLGAVLGYALKR
ncbi:MAG: hypothetical protein AB7O43_18770 [Hyphomicrobiaceae bacterium]